LGGAVNRTADAINWIFCRSLAALRGWPLAYHSQLKLMYGDHHQQPQKDCRYDEFDPFPTSGEEPPVHGQPPSGYHAPPNPTPYHIPWFHDGAPGGAHGRCAILPLAVRPRELRTGRGAPGISARGLGGSPLHPSARYLRRTYAIPNSALTSCNHNRIY
jgi:hypothetical protein